MKPALTIVARDLDDAWFSALWACVERDENGFKFSQHYRIDRGSYAGQERLEIDTCLIDIKYPGSGPLVPQMPPGKEHLAPTTEEQATLYLSYLMTAQKQPNEQYTYGERLTDCQGVNQVEKVVEMYCRDGHNTNQATMEIGMPSDILLSDPPCLRLIDTRIRNDTLHFIVYFRSWDLYNGFPVNLAGLQLLKKYMADRIRVKDGSIRAISKGLHLYDDMWEFASLRIGNSIGVSKETTSSAKR